MAVPDDSEAARAESQTHSTCYCMSWPSKVSRSGSMEGLQTPLLYIDMTKCGRKRMLVSISSSSVIGWVNKFLSMGKSLSRTNRARSKSISMTRGDGVDGALLSPTEWKSAY